MEGFLIENLLDDEPAMDLVDGQLQGMLNVVNNILNDDPLDLYREREPRKPHNEGYFEQTVPLYDLTSFKEHFRMNRHTMEVLIQLVGNTIGQENNFYPVDKMVHYTIWMMAKPESFLAGGDRFDIPKSTSHKIFHKIVNVIANAINDHVQWPDAHKQRRSGEIFEERSGGFPAIIGVIDGCHIKIKQPEENQIDYYNRKQFHSVILQGVCDETTKFINVSTGYPGKMHDARVFRISELGEVLIEGQPQIIENNNHLIADCAYPLTKYMLTPFRDNGHLAPRQVNFNRKLSSVRSTIERAFGRLKGKFRRLMTMEFTDLHLINQFILACCVLHNIIIENEGLDEEDFENEEDEAEAYNGPALDGANANAGTIKRNYLKDMLPM